VISDWTESGFLDSIRTGLRFAAEVDPKTRRRQAAGVLDMCRVSSLAQLVVGYGVEEIEPVLVAATR
jgi:hypothetical protein